jgi:hypothetical protein
MLRNIAEDRSHSVKCLYPNIHATLVAEPIQSPHSYNRLW